MSDEGSFRRLNESRLWRVFFVAALVLLLQIPVAMVRGLIGEREARRDAAVQEVTGKWGRTQALDGPILVVPFERVWTEVDEKGISRSRRRSEQAFFLAEELDVRVDQRSQVRRRGIFDIPVYDSTVQVTGRFAAPDFEGWEVDPALIQWERAQLSVGISDARVLQNAAVLGWAGGRLPFLPGPGLGATNTTGIHAPLELSGRPGSAEFSFELALPGSGAAWFVPFGRQTRVEVTGDWPHPSFQGAWLPAERIVREDGFHAVWSIPFLGRNYPQRWTSRGSPGERISSSRFGVELATPVDPYRLADRSAKYDVLFLGLTFLSLWLFEVLAGVRLHTIQYLLVGGAMVLFYLLEISFAEHLGFGLAYTLASSGIVALVTGYAVAVLGRRQRGLLIGGVVASLYGCLYVLLRNQDHALLVGSIGLFVILGVVMWLTRRVDWYAAVPSRPPA